MTGPGAESVAYARDPSVLWRSTSTGPVLLAADWDTPRHLGGLLAAVWEVLDDPLPRSSIEAELGALLPGADVTTAAPVQEALDELVALDVVEVAQEVAR